MAWLGSPRTPRIYQDQNSRHLDTNKDSGSRGSRGGYPLAALGSEDTKTPILEVDGECEITAFTLGP